MTPEEEIRMLERELERKKQELTERGVPNVEEKEVFREVLREHIDTMRPPLPPMPASPTPPISHIPSSDPTTDYVQKLEAYEDKLRALIERALTGTIEDAVRHAQASMPYLLDELHDHLVDDYYDKLLALKKIKEL